MSKRAPLPGTTTHRPERRRWKETYPRLSQFAMEHLLLLPIGAAIALAWVNLDAESYYQYSHWAEFWVNDVGMALFFGVVAKEVVEATAPGGVLHSWRRVLMPMIAAVGAVAATAMLYNGFVEWADEPMLALAWPVPFATDVALGYFIARLIFSPRHPAIPFVLLLALAADAIGFVALAAFHPTRDLHLAQGLGVMALALFTAATLRWAVVRTFWPYIAFAGGLSWLALYRGGLHPAFALLPILPFLPHAPRDPGFFVDAPLDSQDALNRFEIWFRYPAQIALFFFGLVNAGVPIIGLETGTWAVPFASLIGKPLGIFVAVGAAVAVGLHLPERVRWRDLLVIGFIAASGFTVGLFFATAMLAPGILLRETKMGVLLSVGGIGLAFLSALILRVGRYAR